MPLTYHKEHLLDRAAMPALRAVVAVQPTLECVRQLRYVYPTSAQSFLVA